MKQAETTALSGRSALQYALTTSHAKNRSFKPYPAYKDSGIEWLGNVPEHWELKRVRFLAREPLQYGANEAAGGTDPDQPRFVRITDITERGELRDDTFRSLPYEVAKPYLLQSGDLLFARSGATVGKSFMYKESWGSCCYAGYLIRLRLNTKRSIPEFVNYFSASQNYWDWISSSLIQATIQNVSAEKYANLSLGLPPLSEQHAIVAFLDRETKKIDALIAKKERLLELLAEKRTALISHVVTKGLDPNVPMKDSGIEWLGHIPAHWKVKRLGFIADSIQTGPFGSQLHSEEYIFDGTPVINPANLQNGRIVPDLDCSVDDTTRKRLIRHELKKGDIVFARRGEMGRCALVTEKEDGWLCGTGSLRVRSNASTCYPPYLNLVLSMHGIKDWLTLESVGSTMENLNTGILSRIPLPTSPISEQRVIIDFLDRKVAEIDALMAKVREAIERLKEYRTALISAAVTGKIDVRERA